MGAANTEQIERKFLHLPPQTQIILLEKFAVLAGHPSAADEKNLAAEAAAMAADPDIQREIAEINRELRCTAMDGLDPA